MMKTHSTYIEDSLSNILHPLFIASRMWRYRGLIRQLTWRQVVVRYKGSFIGLGWAFIQPLLMLAVYTFVFSVVFKARWGVQPGETRMSFAVTLFMGLITYNLFSEMVSAAPSIILSNVNFVKKIVFPLDVLPLVHMLSVVVNSLFSLAILLIGVVLVNGGIPLTAFLLPLIWLPMCMLSLGLGYFLASLGVFIRDLNTAVRVIVMMFFFLTPIFYPITRVPPKFQMLIRCNPIAIFVENSRRVVVWGMMPQWSWLLAGCVFSLLVLLFGYVWFMKSKKAFGDVI